MQILNSSSPVILLLCFTEFRKCTRVVGQLVRPRQASERSPNKPHTARVEKLKPVTPETKRAQTVPTNATGSTLYGKDQAFPADVASVKPIARSSPRRRSITGG